MREVTSDYPPGAICLATPMQPRFWEFVWSLEEVQVPRGTRILPARSCDVAGNFNRATHRALTHDVPFEWIWIMGDDHVFPRDFLMGLLAHQVDVVVPINVVKILPYRPLLYHGPFRPEQMDLYDWEELSDPGLMPLPDGDFTGNAGMLLRASVLREIGYPYFKTGQFDPGKLQEDLQLCRELQRRGHTIWIDRDRVLPHMFFQKISAQRNAAGLYRPYLTTMGKSILLDGELEDQGTPVPAVVPEHARPPIQWAPWDGKDETVPV